MKGLNLSLIRVDDIIFGSQISRTALACRRGVSVPTNRWVVPTKHGKIPTTWKPFVGSRYPPKLPITWWVIFQHFCGYSWVVFCLVLFGTFWPLPTWWGVLPICLVGIFFTARRENFEVLEKFIVLNEQLDWSGLRKLWELEGLSDQHFFCTTQAFFHNDKT